jgi:hypothetical protein
MYFPQIHTSYDNNAFYVNDIFASNLTPQRDSNPQSSLGPEVAATTKVVLKNQF